MSVYVVSENIREGGKLCELSARLLELEADAVPAPASLLHYTVLQ